MTERDPQDSMLPLIGPAFLTDQLEGSPHVLADWGQVHAAPVTEGETCLVAPIGVTRPKPNIIVSAMMILVLNLALDIATGFDQEWYSGCLRTGYSPSSSTIRFRTP
ncbi:hypothetical protein FRC12_010262 [Ceratobasidium sp. 428]|nr:hypothetical protein FRC12_010262 [Ceratobasidium sp. 428]